MHTSALITTPNITTEMNRGQMNRKNPTGMNVIKHSKPR